MDTFHATVRQLFRVHGCHWRDTPLGAGFPDALACWGERLVLLEIKSGKKAAKRKGKTADAQKDFADEFPVRRVTNEADALETIAWLKQL
jgi:hypothetical protein